MQNDLNNVWYNANKTKLKLKLSDTEDDVTIVILRNDMEWNDNIENNEEDRPKITQTILHHTEHILSLNDYNLVK